MKKVLMITLALTLCSGVALADHFGTYQDQGGMDCALDQFVPFPGQTQGFIIHKNNGGATASQFTVVDASGLASAGFTSNYLTIGNLADLSVSYGACVADQHVIVTLNWFAFPGTNYTCDSKVSIVAAPSSPVPGEIAIALCDFTYKTGSGGILYVGPTAVDCVPGTGCDPVPVAETTWGGIKALYR